MKQLKWGNTIISEESLGEIGQAGKLEYMDLMQKMRP